jgi:hypothetical protein
MPRDPTDLLRNEPGNFEFAQQILTARRRPIRADTDSDTGGNRGRYISRSAVEQQIA